MRKLSVLGATTPFTPCQSNGEPQPNSRSPTPPRPTRHLHSVGQPNPHRLSQPADILRPKEPPPLALLQDQSRLGEAAQIRRAPSLQNSPRPPLPQLKERPHGLNGLSEHSRSRPWESLSAEEFAQHFHQSVLQSTHKSQHKPKGKREMMLSVAEGDENGCIVRHVEFI